MCVWGGGGGLYEWGGVGGGGGAGGEGMGGGDLRPPSPVICKSHEL